MKFLKSFYIHNTFFRYIAILAGGFTISYWLKALYPIIWLATFILLGLFLFDIFLLYVTKKGIEANRTTPQKLSNSDHNPIVLSFKSLYPFKIGISVIDELPAQFQKRDFRYFTSLTKNEKKEFEYTVRPVERGEYTFGNLNIFASTTTPSISI